MDYYLEEGIEDDPVSEILMNWVRDNDGYSSDDMILYSWIPSVSVPKSFQDKKLNRATVKKTRSHSKKITTFNINVIGLCHRKPCYWLKCKVPPCESSFSTIVKWNFHHRYAHKSILLKCDKCDKKYSIPSAHRAHKSAHAERKTECSTCGKLFPFKSGLRQHLQKHTKQARHRCFSGNCKQSYKWVTDLNRHVRTHLDRMYRCIECTYTTKETRLFKHHQIKHMEEYRYQCGNCDFKTKWLTPYTRHLVACKERKK